MRFRDLLRVSVLLFGGAATGLATVALLGAREQDTNTLVYVSGVWWCLATLAGLWLGRRLDTTPGIAGLLAQARRSDSLPEIEPGTMLFNRLWPLIVLALASAVVGFFFPQVPAIATGYCLLRGAALEKAVARGRGDRGPRRRGVLA